MQQRLTIPALQQQKGQEPLVCLTAYTAPVAKILDAHVDILLVGDTVGMVLYGMDSTLPVTVDMMCAHGKAVVKASERALVVVDLPFGSYQESKEQAYRNAVRIMQETGCQAVKLEGGEELAETVSFLTSRGIPVMGHIGLMPQSVNGYDGYRHHGRDDASSRKIIADAKAIAKAGAFSIVIECVKESLATKVTKAVPVPTIGIGASNQCDGQVLVTDDMAGMFQSFTPRFVKRYANMAEVIDNAAAAFTKEVKSRQFPTKDQCFF